MSQIWQQNGVNWTSHQRNEERKSSEAKLNLFAFLKLSPWAGIEESCGREGLCEDTHFSLWFCPFPVEQDYEFQGGEPDEFHQKKKEKYCFINGLSNMEGWRGRSKWSFHMAYQFSFSEWTFITCSLTPRRCVLPTLKANLWEVIFAYCVESNQEQQYPEWTWKTIALTSFFYLRLQDGFTKSLEISQNYMKSKCWRI